MDEEYEEAPDQPRGSGENTELLEADQEAPKRVSGASNENRRRSSQGRQSYEGRRSSRGRQSYPDEREEEGMEMLDINQDEKLISQDDEEYTTTGLELETVTQGFPQVRQVEQTLAIIKPDAIGKADEIISVIHREGFAILQSRRVKLSPEQAASFYQDMYDTDWFEGNVENLSSGPIMALVLSGPGAVRHWVSLIGPYTWEERSQNQSCLRYIYGTKGNDFKNAVHGSAGPEDAVRELHFFFPELIVEPTIATNLAAHYLDQNVHPVLTVGLSKLVREKPEDPVIWLADWLMANNPNKPKEQGTGVPEKCHQ